MKKGWIKKGVVILTAIVMMQSLTAYAAKPKKKAAKPNVNNRFVISCNGNYFNKYNVLDSYNTLDEAISRIQGNKHRNEWYVYDRENGSKRVWPEFATKQDQVNRAVAWATAIAKDSKHGYTCNGELGASGLKTTCGRWGRYGDYSCSTLVTMAYELTGFTNLRSVAKKYRLRMRNGVIGLNSNTMAQALTKSRCFKNITDKYRAKGVKYLKAGDIVGNSGHVAMYIGRNRLVEAIINETFSPYGSSRAGDQLGWEIRIVGYYGGWSYVYRPKV